MNFCSGRKGLRWIPGYRRCDHPIRKAAFKEALYLFRSYHRKLLPTDMITRNKPVKLSLNRITYHVFFQTVKRRKIYGRHDLMDYGSPLGSGISGSSLLPHKSRTFFRLIFSGIKAYHKALLFHGCHLQL